MTDYPFPLPARLLERLPPPSDDGFVYIDVKVHGVWGGILVIDADGRCVGLYREGRAVQDIHPSCTAEDFEDVRSPSLWNRCVANLSRWIAVDGFGVVLQCVCFICPALFLAGWLWSPWFYAAATLAAAWSLYLLYPHGHCFYFGPLARAVAMLWFALGMNCLLSVLRATLKP